MLGNINHIQRQQSVTDTQPAAANASHALTQGSASVPGQSASASLQREGMHAGMAQVSQQPSLPKNEGAQIGRSPNLKDMQPAIDRALSPASAKDLVSLDKKGQLTLGDGVSDHLKTLLSQTIGKNSQPFVAHQAAEDGSQHLLMDKSGRLFSLQQSGDSFVALHTSTPTQATKAGEALSGKNKASYTLGMDDTHVRASVVNHSGVNTINLPQPGQAALSQLTGVHTDPAHGNEKLQLHDKALYRLNADQVWEKKSDTPHGQLAGQADGKLYAVKDDKTLANLSAGHDSAPFADKIKSFSANAQGNVAVLTEKDNSTTQIHLLPKANAPAADHKTLDLKLDGQVALARGSEQVNAKAVGLEGNRLFVADDEGKVFAGKLPQDGGNTVKLEPYHSPALEAAFGDNHKVQGFVAGEHGTMHALVNDAAGQKHLAPLADGSKPGETEGFKPGWNLSDALVVDNKTGLNPVRPQPHDVMDMGRLGTMALHEGKVHYLDSTTQNWTKTDVGASQLKRGLDNQAYVLDDGQVKKLSINQKADSVTHGDNNVFAVTQGRNSPSAGDPLPGPRKGDGTRALAVIDANVFVTANDKSGLHLHINEPGIRRPTLPPQSLPSTGLKGEIKDLAVDKDHNLFALNHDGQLFKLDSQALLGKPDVRHNVQWQPVTTPGGAKIEQLATTKDHQVTVAGADHQSHQLSGGEWKPVDSGTTTKGGDQPRTAAAMYDRLADATKAVHIPLTGLTAKVDAQVLGQSGMEGRKLNSNFTDRLSAYGKETLKEMVRKPIDAAQHQIKGRDGLSSVYDAQANMFKKLEQAVSSHTWSAKRDDLQSRMDKLDLGEAGKPLMAELKSFQNDLEMSAAKSATLLGKHQGVLKNSGEVNEKFKPSAFKAVVQSMNDKRSGKDLSVALSTVMNAAPLSKDSKAGELLNAFVDKKVDMSYQSDKVATGPRRDLGDAMALTKSRLALDVMTASDLHRVVDKLETLSGKQPTAADLKPIQAALGELRDQQYGGNEVKKITDMGFTRFGALEADYDAVKTFTQAFGHDGSAVNLTARTSLEAGDKAELASKLKDTILSLDNGESLAVNRNYNAGVSTAYVPNDFKVSIRNVPFMAVPSGGVTGDRAYSLSFSRGENGIDVNFGRNGGLNAKVGVSTGQEPNDTKKRFEPDSQHLALLDVRIGASVNAGVGTVRQNGLKFTVSEKDLPGFIDNLLEGKINPLELMNKGNDHRVKEGVSIGFDLDAGVSVDGRAGINLTDQSNKTKRSAQSTYTSAAARASVGVSAGANVVSASHAHSTVRGKFTEQSSTSNNRPTFLNQVRAGGNAAVNVNMAYNQPVGTLPMGINTGASGAITVDTQTSHNISMQLKPAQALQAEDMDSLISSLEKNFADPETQQVLKGVKDLTDTGEKLAILNKHFEAKTPAGDAQYGAIQGLQSKTRQHEAAEKQGATLDSASYSTTYANLSKLDSNGIFHALRKLVSDNLPPTNAERIHGFMEENPALKAVVQKMQSLTNATAGVSLELKDEVKTKVEKGIQNNTLGKDDIAAIFRDSNNLRIKSIDFTQTVKNKEGLAFPLPIVSAGSSADVSMTKLLGKINFSYGQNQNSPSSFSLEGAIAKANPEVSQAVNHMHQQGITLAKQ
ncbi:AvrE-family type 3 secretion system effector [Dickeya fangzhongdai]|uniref:AvrE-family type 3 secretion system effector n=1 Tax=Dickeya fangzhongdai TaxID=1778540 RepID=UPI0023E41B85|nr:AvrE-family type 3 secretion system effector [Dickeya fangzhongdai]WES88265.1 AvrE-family type 3 secretion system effector [Dickeya fangzhongdai]